MRSIVVDVESNMPIPPMAMSPATGYVVVETLVTVIATEQGLEPVTIVRVLGKAPQPIQGFYPPYAFL